MVGLRKGLKGADESQSNQLKIARAALDITKEDSLLSQLRRDTQLAREQLLQAINPSVVGSPLALIHSALTERLERYAKSQQEQLEELKKAATEHQRDVRE